MKELQPAVEQLGWFAEHGYLLKRARMLDNVLTKLYDLVFVVLARFQNAISHWERQRNNPGYQRSQEHLSEMKLDAPEADCEWTAGAFYLAVYGIKEEEATRAAAALVRGLYGAEPGEGFKTLKASLTEMNEALEQLPPLSCWTSLNEPCKNFALAGQPLIRCMGILELNPDNIPLVSESITDRIDRLENLECLVYYVRQVIYSATLYPVTLHGPTCTEIKTCDALTLHNHLEYFLQETGTARPPVLNVNLPSDAFRKYLLRMILTALVVDDEEPPADGP